MIPSSTARKAHTLVANAVRRGELTREVCQDCGKPEAEAHHDDYSRPLDVRWLCRSHHRRWHSQHPSGVTWDDGPTRIVSFQIPPAEYRRIVEIAKEEERTVSGVIRLAVRRYLEERAA